MRPTGGRAHTSKLEGPNTRSRTRTTATERVVSCGILVEGCGLSRALPGTHNLELATHNLFSCFCYRCCGSFESVWSAVTGSLDDFSYSERNRAIISSLLSNSLFNGRGL